MCAGIVLGGFRLRDPIAVAVLAAVALAAERESIRLSPTIEFSVGSLVYIFAAVVCGPLAAVLVGGIGLLADLPRRDGEQPGLRWLNWTAIRVISAGAVGLTAAAIASAVTQGFWGLFAAVAGAFVVEERIGSFVVACGSAIRGSGELEGKRQVHSLRRFSEVFRFKLHSSQALAFSFKTTPWSVALFAVPALAAHRLLSLYRQQRETTEALGSANARLAKANLSFATALVATLDARDR